MGSGLSGGPLTGGPTTAVQVIAPAGQSAILAGPLGAGASDVVTKAGSTVANATVNALAALFQIGTGIFGTEVPAFTFTKTAINYVLNSWKTEPDATGFWWYVGATPYLLLTTSSGVLNSGYGLVVNPAFGGTTVFRTISSQQGRVDQMGTDSTGTPGAATIDKGTGKSSIAAAAASVTVTCNQCSAASRVLITQHARDATCKELIVVPAAGSFVVSGSAAATAAVPFSWEVSNIL